MTEHAHAPVSDLGDRVIRSQRLAVLLLTAAVSAVFIGMIRQFLIALFLAAVFSGLAYPLHEWLLQRTGGRKKTAAAITLVALLLILVLPMLGLLNLVAMQAVQLSEQLLPWLQEQIGNPDLRHLRLPDWLPFSAELQAIHPQITGKIGELAASAGKLVYEGLSATTKGTAEFFLNFFVMLYAMFFFLREGAVIREKLLRLTPLTRDAQERLLAKGMSVTRATLTGTLVIGLVQGLLGGIAFMVVGIQGAAFWGALMAVASVIPSVGTALVWVPAVGYLALTGEGWLALGLGLWSMLVIGGIDNLLRPILVGGDTELPDILVLISTFGGIAMFGITGLIIGPVIAALCVTMWDLYYLAFRDILERKDSA